MESTSETTTAGEIGRADLGKEVSFKIGKSKIVGELESVAHYKTGATFLTVDGSQQQVHDPETVVTFL